MARMLTLTCEQTPKDIVNCLIMTLSIPNLHWEDSNTIQLVTKTSAIKKRSNIEAMFGSQILRRKDVCFHRVVENPYLAIVNFRGFGQIEIIIWRYSGPTSSQFSLFWICMLKSVFSHLYASIRLILIWNPQLYKIDLQPKILVPRIVRNPWAADSPFIGKCALRFITNTNATCLVMFIVSKS